ncbi:RND transporter [Aestuariivirga litoralis]|uniref:RND transporter n=1 Tax=Aestuariivirga litoralis TaxID=2650924 RepID=A0A2W2AYS3_9HYPH|nr:efflux transporter outer membrane subunit [Aestuariivirga litoralis]PZF78942.1 RND transporter [Aestuariivirga litoralis]
MMIARRSFLGLLGLALAGCTVGPDYIKPDVASPETFRYQIKTGKSYANEGWWQLFSDPVLHRLVNQSLAQNWDITIATARVNEAAGILVTRGAPLYPQVGYSGIAQRERLSDELAGATSKISPNPQNLYEPLFTASWEIDLWGRIRRQQEAAQANLVGAEEARRGVILTLASAVATTYFKLRALDAQLVVSRGTLANYGKLKKLFGERFKYGQVSEVVVAQITAQYETVAASIPLIEEEIAKTENALSVLVGDYPHAITRGVPFAAIRLPKVPSDLPSDMLRQRPDIAQAEQELIAANARIGAAMAQYYPQVSLTGSLGVASGALSNLLTGPAGVWAVAANLMGPIFDGGAIKGQVEATEAQKMAALANYVKTIHVAFQDVADGLVGYQKSLQSLAARNRAVTALKTTVRLSFLKFEEGQESYTTVLTAENDLYSAQLEAINTRFRAFSSLVDVYKALGGGWTLDVGPDPALATSPQQARESAAQATGG